jgi:hypothetical protein
MPAITLSKRKNNFKDIVSDDSLNYFNFNYNKQGSKI